MIKLILQLLIMPEFWTLIKQVFKKDSREEATNVYKEAIKNRDPKAISDYVNNRT